MKHFLVLFFIFHSFSLEASTFSCGTVKREGKFVETISCTEQGFDGGPCKTSYVVQTKYNTYILIKISESFDPVSEEVEPSAYIVHHSVTSRELPPSEEKLAARQAAIPPLFDKIGAMYRAGLQKQVQVVGSKKSSGGVRKGLPVARPRSLTR